ncbi:MAG: hypothetical protein QXS81_05600, partial [Candidatus Micrarchaeaceae archaeon]
MKRKGNPSIIKFLIAYGLALLVIAIFFAGLYFIAAHRFSNISANAAMPLFHQSFKVYFPNYLSGVASPLLYFNGVPYNYSKAVLLNTTKNCSAYAYINFTKIAYASSSERFVFSNASINGVYSNSSNLAISECANSTIIPYYAIQYYLSESSSPSNGGSVLPGSNWYDNNTYVTISAIPHSRWFFSNWQGSGPGSYSGTSS